MSLHSYLTNTYGPVKDKKKKKSKTKKPPKTARAIDNEPTGSSKTRPLSGFGITENSIGIIGNSSLKDNDSIGTNRGSSTGIMWKNLTTNEIVETLDHSHEDTGTKKIRHHNVDGKKHEDRPIQTAHRDEYGHILTGEQIKQKKEEEDLREVNKMKHLKKINAGELQLYIQNNNLNTSQVKLRASRVYSGEDPASQFVESKTKKRTNISTSLLGRRLYEGLCLENRFDIKPGARWDGVDRSNGFEKKWFAKRNEINERKMTTLVYNDDEDD